jgi:dTDP-4-dehydrorhamnose 3,5-epimerase
MKTELPGVLIVQTKRFSDARGFFVETFHSDHYSDLGICDPFLQDNWSRSEEKVLRGLHLQHPHGQSKLIGVLRGLILDVAVDVRVHSPTFGRHVAVELSEENGLQLFVPRGFAHGFIVLSGPADIIYKCDNFYNPATEITIRWNDPALGIDWGIANPVVSDRDASGPLLSEVHNLPIFEA